MSIKTKILLITSALLIIATGTIYWVNRDAFMKDKSSYLYSSTLQSLEQEGRSISDEYQEAYSRLSMVLMFFQPDQDRFSEQIKQLAANQKWGLFALFRSSPTEDLALIDSINATDFSLRADVRKALKEVQNNSSLTFHNLKTPDKVTILFRQGEYSLYSEFTLKSLSRIVSEGRLALYKKLGNEFLPAKSLRGQESVGTDIAKLIASQNASGVKEISSRGEKYLVSFREISSLKLYLVEPLKTRSVFAVVRKTMTQTLIITLIVVGFGLLAMFLGVDKITKNLLIVSGEMETFSKTGEAKKIALQTKDEVGKISRVFNTMLDKITLLLQQTAEKSRMAAELETAKEVQKTLLPKTKLDTERYFIKGFYEPASECGGDLWFYSTTDDSLFLFVADATGHGVSAALITAAARSILSVAMAENIMDPAKILGLINKTLCETAKGEKMMTAFACTLDLNSGILSYANASHEPPVVLPLKGEEKLKKADLIFLNESPGRRLGDKPETNYASHSLKLEPGQCLFIYTDGLTDALNKENEAFSERRVVKMAVESANRRGNKSFHEVITKNIQEHTESQEQPDDITFVSMMIKEA